MKIWKDNYRSRALLALLSFVVATYAVNALHVRALEGSLAAYWNQTGHGDFTGMDPTAAFTVSKQYLLWGPPQGRVAVYTVTANAEGQWYYLGYTHCFEWRDHAWRATDSWVSTDAHNQSRGAAVFRSNKKVSPVTGVLSGG